jgi:hypothetical protein
MVARGRVRSYAAARRRAESYRLRRVARTGLPVGDRQSPAAFSPNAQKCLMISQLIVLKAPVVRMRAVSMPEPQSIVPLP